MTVFRAFIKTIRANISTLIVYLIVFVAFGHMSAAGNAKTMESVFEEQILDVYVIDRDNSIKSQAVKNYIADTCNLVDLGTEDLETIHDDVRFSRADYAVIIPSGFENGEPLEYISAGMSLSAELMTARLDTYCNNIEIYKDNGYNLKEAIEATDSVMKETSDMEVKTHTVASAPKSNYLTYMFNFGGYALLMMLCIGIGTVLVQLHQEDLMKRVECSAYTFIRRKAESFLGILIMGVSISAVVIIVAVLSDIGNSDFSKWPYYTINIIAIMLVGIALGYLLSAISSDANIINLMSNIFILSACFISGVFVSRQYIAESVLRVARFQPLYWFVEGNHLIGDSTMDSVLTSSLWTCFGMEVLFAIALTGLGLIVSRARRR